MSEGQKRINGWTGLSFDGITLQGMHLMYLIRSAIISVKCHIYVIIMVQRLMIF